MAQRPKRRIPRVVMVAVPALALGLALLLVALAWRSNRVGRSEPLSPDTPIQTQGGDSFLDCTNCHGDLDKVFKEGKVPLLEYTHEAHFSKGVSDCSVCHSAETHMPDKINKPTMGRCFTCHGITKVAIARGTCSTCHPPGMPKKPPTHLVSTWLPSGHAEEALANQFECLTCHQQTFCSACHGLTMPHPEGWKDSPHTEAFFQDPATCQQCHPRAPDARDSCDSCHHPQDPKGTAWRAYHHKVVETLGAYDCFQCHDPATCSTCHVEGKENFEADIHKGPSTAPSGG